MPKTARAQSDLNRIKWWARRHRRQSQTQLLKARDVPRFHEVKLLYGGLEPKGEIIRQAAGGAFKMTVKGLQTNILNEMFTPHNRHKRNASLRKYSQASQPTNQPVSQQASLAFVC